MHLLEGEISVLAALEAGVRPIQRVLLDRDKDSEETQTLRAAARRAQAPVDLLTRAEIDVRAGGATHGGVLAIAGPRTLLTLDALLALPAQDARAPWYALLDGIEDPFNFGQAVRALYAAGAAGLVLRPRTWRGGDGVIVRASAGASELLPTAHCATLDDACAVFRTAGYAIAMTARDRRSEPVFDANLNQRLLLLIGGEKRGLKRALLDSADIVLRIPYARRYPHSLGSAGSAAVLAFEMMRQRMQSVK
jgi:23S rRNA (guanosine2251-2'-O)-methyltransferase